MRCGVHSGDGCASTSMHCRYVLALLGNLVSCTRLYIFHECAPAVREFVEGEYDSSGWSAGDVTQHM